MKQTLTIDNKEITFKANALTAIKYRDQFGRDLFKDMDSLGGDLSTDMLEHAYHLAYIMAAQGDKTVPADPDEWLDSFDVFPLDEIIPAVTELWRKSNTTSVISKNV